MEPTTDAKVENRIGFIGGGNMAQAIAQGLIKTGTVPAANIMASSPSNRSFGIWHEMGAKTTHDNGEVVMKCDVVFLSVKPNMLDTALESLKGGKICDIPTKLFISVIAGSTLEALEKKLHGIVKNPRVIRVMPNTPMAVGAGCTVLAAGPKASADDVELVRKFLSAGGMCEIVPENLINSVGALAGSGPAFVYQMIEALSDGAVKMGVPRVMATKFAAQTVMGAARMVLETGRHPGQLKDEVCSPGGTTIAGIHAMERAGVRAGLMDAVQAAKNRSDELGK